MKFVVAEKKTLITVLSLILIAVLLIIISGSVGGASSAYFGVTAKKLPICSVQTSQKDVALTFDTAYGEDKTEGILDVLHEYGANATFFLIGFWVDNFPQKTQSIVDAGCEIGTHSDTHPHMTRLSPNECTNELALSIEKIEGFTKCPVRLFRAPYGEYSDKVITAAESLNLYTIQWDVDSFDWKQIPAADIIKRVMSKVKNGSIILFHNNADLILNFLPVILHTLKDDGYSFKKVSDLIYKDNCKIDDKGTQIQLTN